MLGLVHSVVCCSNSNSAGSRGSIERFMSRSSGLCVHSTAEQQLYSTAGVGVLLVYRQTHTGTQSYSIVCVLLDGWHFWLLSGGKC